MNEPRRWQVAAAVLALVVVGTAVLVVGKALRDPSGRGERRESRGASVTQAEAAPGDTGVTRGGRAPRGQAPVVLLTFPRFQDAFNADAGERRVLILLSPT